MTNRLLKLLLYALLAVPPHLIHSAPEYTVTSVFTSGDGYHTYRIPAIVRANDGTLLAFCEGRSSGSDGGDIDMVLKRSTDNGTTWGSLILVHEEGGTAPITIGNPAPVVDRTTGHIHLLFTRENDTVFHTKSTDNGLNWSARTEITANVKQASWGWYATGPCHGVQLTRGDQAGRLVVPANHRVGADGSDSGAFGAQIIYSDDHGVTWQMTATAEDINGTGANETTLVELNTPGTAPSATSTHQATDIPKAISPSAGTTITSTLSTAAIAGTLTDVNVTLDISHTWVDDLDITLIHPDGTRIELSTDNGGSGHNYTNTTFDQQAGTSITAGSAPFSGTYRPEGDLNTLNLDSRSPNGTWTLEVDDDYATLDGGSLNSWSITLTTDAPVSGAVGSHIYINSRDYGSDPGNRSEAFSGDGGSSYSVPYNGNAHFVTPICQGSLVRFSATDEGDASNRILFSSPNGGSRSNGSLWTSTDEATSWSAPKTLYSDGYAYSDMTKTTSGHLGVLAECNPGGVNYDFIKFIRVNEEWLDVPPPAAENPAAAFWTFEEKAIGNTADTTADAILDLDPTNNQRHLTADAAFTYSAGSLGTALTFAGNGGLSIADADTDNNFDFAADDSFTIEAVFRIPNGSSNTGAIVAKDLGGNLPSWWLRVERGGDLRFLVSDNASEAIATSGATLVNDGNWHTVVAIKDATTDRLKLYLDGTLIDDIEDTTTGSHANSQALCIGKFNTTGRDFIGDIDFVRITPAVVVPAQFVSAHTQFDADVDNIPDAYERSLTGDTSTLGTGDADADSSSDLLEFASGSSAIDSASTPATNMNPVDANNYQFIYIQRDLPAWLTLTPEFSTDLSNWGTTLPDVTITSATSPAGAGLTEYTFTLTFQSAALPTVFSRLSVESSQTP